VLWLASLERTALTSVGGFKGWLQRSLLDKPAHPKLAYVHTHRKWLGWVVQVHRIRGVVGFGKRYVRGCRWRRLPSIEVVFPSCQTPNDSLGSQM
jgi:hypothetical protein